MRKKYGVYTFCFFLCVVVVRREFIHYFDSRLIHHHFSFSYRFPFLQQIPPSKHTLIASISLSLSVCSSSSDHIDDKWLFFANSVGVYTCCLYLVFTPFALHCYLKQDNFVNFKMFCHSL